MTPIEKKAREIYDLFYLANKDSLDVLKIKSKAIAKTNALICVGNEYHSLREQLFNLRSCKVIESEKTYLARLEQLINEEQQVKQHIKKL